MLNVTFSDAAPFYYQVTIVTKRALVALWRSHDYLFSRLFSHISLSLFISLALLRLGRSVGDLQSRVFGMYVFFRDYFGSRGGVLKRVSFLLFQLLRYCHAGCEYLCGA